MRMKKKTKHFTDQQGKRRQKKKKKLEPRSQAGLCLNATRELQILVTLGIAIEETKGTEVVWEGEAAARRSLGCV